jgi:hypothetical protein
MKRYLLTLVFLAGCAPIMSDKPGATQSEVNVDQAQCQYAAKASDGTAAACAPNYCNYCACAPFYRRTGSARPTPSCPTPNAFWPQQ